MLTRSNFSIGCLSVSAVVLFAAVLNVAVLQNRSAEASGMLDSAGSYKLLTGQFNEVVELVYLIDDRTNRMVVYHFNESTRQIEPTFAAKLDDADAGQQKQRPRLKP